MVTNTIIKLKVLEKIAQKEYNNNLLKELRNQRRKKPSKGENS